ncbi:hypothetical protein [Sphingomonas qomolangmaensis]|uniref:Tryptophan-rich sensory protein n=1 Tax=Sphingomonas qomolangmaensis TaxID=2918765 RepID=A0ABY5LCA6_9SPHN|nr:hypothetical protein [Sphingomonas qomolangmaensis]UUL84052.1 hypothetical protein NMP03_07670 [Sphingomonas qomolangmaensis]
MLSLYLSSDGFRAITVLLLAIGQAVMSQWPDWRKWPETIASRSARQSTPAVPIDWAFAVWGLIFLECFGFGIWQLLPGQLDDPLLRSIGWLAAGVFALNIAWEYYVPRRDIDWGSVAIIVAALAVLLTIVWRIEAAEPHNAATFWLVAAPFQLFSGWISAATFVNLSSTLRFSGVAIGTGRSVALIAAAALLGSVIAAKTGALIYGGAIAWALFGIVVANRGRVPNSRVAIAAGLLAPAVPLAALLGS